MFFVELNSTKAVKMKTSNTKEKLRTNIIPPETVDRNILEVFDYAYKDHRDIDIEITQPEFTSLCPLTGLPDFGTINIRYRPSDKIIELKSLKYYLLQYRNVGVFYEHVVNQILEDLVSVLYPKFMEIRGIFTPRGGITTTVRVVFEEKD